MLWGMVTISLITEEGVLVPSLVLDALFLVNEHHVVAECRGLNRKVWWRATCTDAQRVAAIICNSARRMNVLRVKIPRNGKEEVGIQLP